MRLIQAVCLLLVLAPLPALARHTQAPSVPAPLARPDVEAHANSFADGVTTAFDIVYATPVGAPPLTLDVYTPRTHPAPLPMVVYVHGGGWKVGDSRKSLSFTDFPRALAALAAQGYVVASVNYRLSPQVHFPVALQDVKSAIRWLRGHAANYGADPTRVAVWGASSGAQLAAMAGATCGVARFEPEGEAAKDAPSDCVDAVIDWYGPSDMDSPNAKSAGDAPSEAGNYLGCEPAACAPGVVRLASPLTFLSEITPPFLIQHGSVDTDVSPKQARQLYEALKQKGVPAEIEFYPDVGHGFMKGNAPDTATVTKAMAKLTAFLAGIFPPRPADNAPRAVKRKS